ncbi:MAG: DUF1361 domain-containing protein [Candidatus Saccharimonadales bacterium]
MKRLQGVYRLFAALILSSLVSISLYIIGLIFYGAAQFWFLSWNLLLAWLPVLFMLLLVQYLKTQRWVSAKGFAITLLWLSFLPNSFYMISDLIHLAYLNSSNLLYYVVLLFSFAFNGLILGYLSLYIFQEQLLKRLKKSDTNYWVAAVLLLCSFAIYLGRYLRWSTWDIILHPVGVVFDISDRFVNPTSYGQTFQVTLWFFFLLMAMYFILRQFVETIREEK